MDFFSVFSATDASIQTDCEPGEATARLLLREVTFTSREHISIDPVQSESRHSSKNLGPVLDAKSVQGQIVKGRAHSSMLPPGQPSGRDLEKPFLSAVGTSFSMEDWKILRNGISLLMI
jgi:hypothetical protein